MRARGGGFSRGGGEAIALETSGRIHGRRPSSFPFSLLALNHSARDTFFGGKVTAAAGGARGLSQRGLAGPACQSQFQRTADSVPAVARKNRISPTARTS